MNLLLYTDASDDAFTQVTVCGYCMVVDDEIVGCDTHIINDFNHIDRAEMKSIVLALSSVLLMTEPIKIITIKTDAKNNFDCKNKNDKRFREFYRVRKKLRNKGIKVIIEYVKGHGEDKYNILVDQLCYNKLTTHLEKIKEEVTQRVNFI